MRLAESTEIPAALLGSSDERILALPGHLLDLLPVGVCVFDLNGTIIRYNRAAADLWGRAPILGNPPTRFCGPGRIFRPDGEAIAPADWPAAKAVAKGVPIRNQEIVIERPGGSRVTLLVSADPLRDTSGTLVGAVECFRDITDWNKAEQRLRKNEVAAQRLAAIVTSSEDAILAKDLNGIITDWNDGATRLFGYTPDEVIGKPVTILIPPERQNEEPMILARIRRGDRVEHYETVRQRKDGSLIDISLSVSPVKNADGVIIGASKIARDITERRRAQERQDLLLREMNHRIKNLFALAAGIVTLSARSADTPEALAQSVRDRLEALARAQTLTLSQHFGEGAESRRPTTLHALIRAIVAPYEDRPEDEGARVTIQGADMPVSAGSLTSLALLLHEFATNAAKYGALKVAAGSVEIACSDEDGQIGLVWRERGGAPPQPENMAREGFGSLLARMTVKGQLHGEITRDWSEDGLIIRLSIPRDRICS